MVIFLKFMRNVESFFFVCSTSSKTKNVEQISLVIKCMPDAGQRGPVIEELKVYEKEKEMFVNVIPELSKIASNEFFAAK